MKMVEETLPDGSQVHVQVPTSEGDLHHGILAVKNPGDGCEILH